MVDYRHRYWRFAAYRRINHIAVGLVAMAVAICAINKEPVGLLFLAVYALNIYFECKFIRWFACHAPGMPLSTFRQKMEKLQKEFSD